MLMDKIRGESDGVHEPLETFLEFEETYRTLLVLLTETPKRLPLWMTSLKNFTGETFVLFPFTLVCFFPGVMLGDQTMQMYIW